MVRAACGGADRGRPPCREVVRIHAAGRRAVLPREVHGLVVAHRDRLAAQVPVVEVLALPASDAGLGVEGLDVGIGDRCERRGVARIGIALNVGDLDHASAPPLQPFEGRDFVERANRGTAALVRVCPVRVLADHGEFQRLVDVERKQTVVLQQDHGLGGHPADRHLVGGGVARSGLAARGLQGPDAGHHAQDAPDLVVDNAPGDLAALDSLAQGIREEEGVVVIGGAHLDIEPVHRRVMRAVRPAPVGNAETVELPLALEDVLQEVLVFPAPLPAEPVVGGHERQRARADGLLEGGEVDLAERPLVDDRVDPAAVPFLVVQRVVLHARRDVVVLDAAHHLGRHPADLVGVFAEVLEVAAAEGRADDVDAGSEDDVLVAVPRLRAQRLAEEPAHGRVPRRRQRRAGRKIRAVIVLPSHGAPRMRRRFAPYAVGAVGHRQPRNSEPFNSRRVELRIAVAEGYLFGERHLFQQGVDTLLRLCRRHARLRLEDRSHQHECGGSIQRQHFHNRPPGFRG